MLGLIVFALIFFFVMGGPLGFIMGIVLIGVMIYAMVNKSSSE